MPEPEARFLSRYELGKSRDAGATLERAVPLED
jgi:hypothetical protein